MANAVPQPSGHDPERGSAPPSRMDADHCNDAPLLMLIKVPARRTDTKISKRRTKPQKEDHLFPEPLSPRGPVQVHTRWQFPPATPRRQEGRDPAPQTNNRWRHDTDRRAWRNPGGLVRSPRNPSHPKVIKILRKHTSSGVYPLAPQIPDRVVPHTFVQPIDCLMSNPRPGDTNWIPGTSGWREGVTARLS